MSNIDLKELFREIHNPELKKTGSDINRSKKTTIEKVVNENAEPDPRSILNAAKLSSLLGEEAPRPLTEEEAEAIDMEINGLRSDISALTDRISNMQQEINTQIHKTGDKPDFNVDLRRKRALRKALRKALGVEGDELTYDAYILALKTKNLLQEQEADSYTKGEWAEEE